jgi:hypothetical protein
LTLSPEEDAMPTKFDLGATSTKSSSSDDSGKTVKLAVAGILFLAAIVIGAWNFGLIGGSRDTGAPVVEAAPMENDAKDKGMARASARLAPGAKASETK